MSAALLIGNLLRVAKEDLDGARLLAAAGNRNAIYLCEQAAEKLIRAILTSENKHAGIKHDLDAMVDMVPDDNPLNPALWRSRIRRPPTSARFGEPRLTPRRGRRLRR